MPAASPLRRPNGAADPQDPADGGPPAPGGDEPGQRAGDRAGTGHRGWRAGRWRPGASAAVVGTSVGRVTVAVVEAYAELARRVLAGPARLGRTRTGGVDGPSGAGKSVFAARLADAWPGCPAAGGHRWCTPTTCWTAGTTSSPSGRGCRSGCSSRCAAGRPGAYRRYSWVAALLPAAGGAGAGRAGADHGGGERGAGGGPAGADPVGLRHRAGAAAAARALPGTGRRSCPSCAAGTPANGRISPPTARRTAADLVVDGAPDPAARPSRYYVRARLTARILG